MKTSLSIMLLAALTAACNGANAPAANQANAAATGNSVAALGEGQRNAVFIRAIRDAGLDCQHVDGSRAAGSYRGMPVWNVTCQGHSHWTIVIGPGDTAQILNADEARLVTDVPPAGNSVTR